MFRAFSVGKKVIRKREQQKFNEGYIYRIKNARPSTTNHGQHRLLNNGKKMMLMQNQFTEIERENRLLLEKIVGKKQKKSTDQRQKMNKSLNSNFRKRQLQNIEIENARLLKRLQERKSDYQTQKFQKDWKKQKVVIQNISNYPYIIRDISASASRKGRRRTFSKQLQRTNQNNHNLFPQNCQMQRTCNFQGLNMTVAINLNQQKLTIVGDLGKAKDLKIISIQRVEALQFIQEECDGKIQRLFALLHFDHQEQALYLVPKDSQLGSPAQIE